MKLAHNFRFTAITRDAEERSSLKNRFREWLGEPELEFEEEDLAEPGMDTLFSLKLWVDSGSLCNRIVKLLRDELSEVDRTRLVEDAENRLDERGNLFFRLDKGGFLEGDLHFVLRGDVIQVRVNPAAFPKNPDTARGAVRRIFLPDSGPEKA